MWGEIFVLGPPVEDNMVIVQTTMFFHTYRLDLGELRLSDGWILGSPLGARLMSEHPWAYEKKNEFQPWGRP